MELVRPVEHFYRAVVVRRGALRLVTTAQQLCDTIESETVRSIQRRGYAVVGSSARLQRIDELDLLRRHPSARADDYLLHVDVDAYEAPKCSGCGDPVVPCEIAHQPWELCRGWRHLAGGDPSLFHSIVCADSPLADDVAWKIAQP